MQERLVENLIAKKKAQEAGLPIGKRVNPKTGKVSVFMIHEQKYKEVFAVDAREMINMGAATLDPVEVEGPGGRRKIDAGMLDDFIAKGFKLIGGEPVQTGNDQGSGQGNGGGNDGDKPVDFSKYLVPELKGFAELAGIKDFATMKKPQLIEALTAAKFVPPATA